MIRRPRAVPGLAWAAAFAGSTCGAAAQAATIRGVTPSTTDRIAVQSYCFRGFASNEEVAAKAREIGLAAVEPCRVHVDFTDEAAQDAAIAAYDDAGVRLVSCGVNSITGDAAGAECYFRFARKAGLSVISADITPPASWDTFAAAERLAERYDVNVALHNHGGAHWLGNAQMLEEVFRRTGPRIGLMLDTAWAIDSREDPVKMVRRFGDRLMGVHLKDFVYSRDREPVDVVIGTGILDLPALVTALGEVGFDGVPIIEYEGDVNNPVPALTDCVTEIAAAWNL